ncbi:MULTISPECIES: heme exporter protein CcmD [Stenotrophomonas]|uniref:heme exporter protein CcmD n=1 Tax=Stenotrophomonas TaxID=40323 RepID=UPI0010440079|nr:MULTISPECIES: heme exporter protein CcmD [Stenotrophomonas]MDT9579987.1 heme exporter protein CcmD [Stenotrophomonas indicatrix]MDV3514866.1 heme exporter protein CcmD [Stenotrophomonas sp. C1657]TDB33323.1 heme exporter protein CcmD [Stenotrophomonas sp. TEPEL]
MTHLPYLIAAFAVFLLVLACDALGSWLRLRSARQLAQRRQQRLQARSNASAPAPLATELSR